MNLLDTFVPMVLMIAGSLGFISVTSNEMNLLSSAVSNERESPRWSKSPETFCVFIMGRNLNNG